MSYKEDLRIVRTNKLLSSTIVEMMMTESLDKISVIDICKKAGVNRATFYAHFEDKFHLLNYALDELKEEIFASITNKIKATNELDLVSEVAHSTFNFVKGHQGNIVNILANNRNEKVIGTMKDSLARTVKQHLQKFHATYPEAVPLSLTSVAYAGALIDLCLWYLDNSDKFTESDMHSHITALFTTKRD